MASIGYATLQVIPSMRGTAAALSGESNAVGTQAATAFSGGFNRILSGGLIAAGVVAATGASLLAIGSSFDDAYDTIQAGTGATGDALEGLKDAFRGVVADVPTDFASAADAITSLNQRLELTGQPLERIAEQFLNLSNITGDDLNSNINSVTRAFGDWSVATGNQSEVLDRFFRASQASGVSVGELADGVVQFGSPLRQLGFTLDESIALFASFGEAGVNTSKVMSGMRQAVKNFASGLAENETGVRNFGDVLEGVRAGTFDLSDAMTVFGARAGADMFAAIQEGRFDLEAFLEVMRGTGDGINETADKTRDFGESFEVIRNNIMLLLEGPASALMGWVSAIAGEFETLVQVLQAGGLGAAIEYLRRNFDGLGPMMQAVVIGAAVLGGVLLLLAAKAAIAALAFLAIPLAIAALAAGLVYAYTHFEGFREVVDSVASWITGTAIPAIQEFAGIVRDAFSNVDWGQVWDTVVTAVTNAFNTIREVLASVDWAGIWATVSTTAVSAFNTIQTVVSTVIAVVQGLWSTFGSTIISLAQTAWNTVTGVITSAVNIILGIWNVFAGVFTGDWSRVWSGLTQVVSGVWNAMISLVQGAWNALIALVRLGLTALRGVWDAVWQALPGVLRSAWETIKSVVSSGVTAVVTFLQGLPGRAISAISAMVSGLTDKGRAAMRGLWDAMQNVWDSVKTWLTNLPGKIVNAVGDMADALVDTGAAVIEGLKRGMESAWDSVTGWLSSLNPASWFNDINLRLGHAEQNLVPTGVAVMGGLESGMRSGWDRIAQWLRQLDPSAILFGGDTWGSIFDIDEPTLVANRVILDIQDAWRDMRQMFADMPFGFISGTQAGNAFTRAIQDQAARIRNYVDSLVDAGDFDGASAALTRMVNALRDIAIASGMSADAVDALITSLFGTLNLDDIFPADERARQPLPADAVSSRYSGQLQPITVRVDPSGADSALVELLRRMIRVEAGGNVQAALGG